jgi:uncharacterized secreted repeat protein (TIGR03808 family)
MRVAHDPEKWTPVFGKGHAQREVMDRRRFIAGSLASVAVPALAAPALAAPLSQYGVDAAQFGVRPGAADDQTAKLQRAVNETSGSRTPLVLAPGVYRIGGLQLWTGTHLVGVRGATFLTFTGGNSLVSAENSDAVTLSGLAFQGGNSKLPDNRGLVHCSTARGLRVTDCEVHNAGGNGIVLEQCDGMVTGTTIVDAADAALHANNSRGLVLSSNVIRNSGNNGISVWQSDKRYDGTIVADNRIEDTHARAGGTGPYGNAISVFRAGNVIVRGNVIRRAAFTAVRGNSASNIQIVDNNCSELDEVAIYSEFTFEGAVIANNLVDGAQTGISVTNFNEGGRLASVHGNLVRNLTARRPGTPIQECAGIGINADTAATGNVVENAAGAGFRVGFGPYLRDVTVSGNVVRNARAGVEVSVVAGAGGAAITGNIIDGVKGGAVIGMEWDKQVTGDLVKDGTARYPQLTIANNQTR